MWNHWWACNLCLVCFKVFSMFATVIDLLITFVVKCEQTSYCNLHIFGCVDKCSSFINNCKTGWKGRDWVWLENVLSMYNKLGDSTYMFWVWSNYTRKNLPTCSKSANKPSTSCVRTTCYKLSTSLEQAVNNL